MGDGRQERPALWTARWPRSAPPTRSHGPSGSAASSITTSLWPGPSSTRPARPADRAVHARRVARRRHHDQGRDHFCRRRDSRADQRRGFTVQPVWRTRRTLPHRRYRHTRDLTSGRYARNVSLSSRLRDLGHAERQVHSAGPISMPGVASVWRFSKVSWTPTASSTTSPGVASSRARTRTLLTPSSSSPRASASARSSRSGERRSTASITVPSTASSSLPTVPSSVLRASSPARSRADARFHRFRAIADVRDVPSVPFDASRSPRRAGSSSSRGRSSRRTTARLAASAC